MSRSRSPLSVIPLLVLLTLQFEGCALFSALGDSISHAYTNTVAYFNVYYNAKRLFDEAEGEILSAEKTHRASRDRPEPTVPGGARQKLNTVIDKCSNILAFHSASSMVDDALLLIGKSYYYQGEYVKAERKFAELFAQFPTSNLIHEAQVWYLRSLAQLKRYPDIFRDAPLFLAGLQKANRKELAGDVYLILGSVHEEARNIMTAIGNYQLAVALLSEPTKKAEAQKALADLYFANRDFRNSTAAYRRLLDIAPDEFFEYDALLSIAKAYRAQKNYDASLQTLNELLDDFRFQQRRDAVLLERARVLAERGDIAEALDEYEYADTTFARTEVGARAAFEKGELLERLGDYDGAWKAYAKAGTGPVAALASEARRKSQGFNKYFELHKTRAYLDSLKNVWEAGDHGRLNLDSLRKEEARVSYGLGEVFYSDIPHVDSTVYYYTRALELFEDSISAPRAMYVLSDIVRAHPGKTSLTWEEWQNRLASTYPSSSYGLEVRRLMGETLDTPGVDPAEQQYRLAERKIDSQLYREAIRDLKSIASGYPKSSYASKSLYTIGWIFENHLGFADSALAYYRIVVEEHPGTQYAEVVKRKLPSAAPPEPASPGSPEAKEPQKKEAERDEVRVRAREEAEKKTESQTPLPSAKKRDND